MIKLIKNQQHILNKLLKKYHHLMNLKEKEKNLAVIAVYQSLMNLYRIETWI